jgi:hypothetical protein
VNLLTPKNHALMISLDSDTSLSKVILLNVMKAVGGAAQGN